MIFGTTPKLKEGEIYQATTNYFIALVQMRFSVASLFLAAIAFLIGAIFSDYAGLKSKDIVVASLGLAVTSIVWVLELRTASLIANLANLGKGYETDGSDQKGFFSLLSHEQPIGIRVPFVKSVYLSNSNRVVNRIFSHTFALNTLYLTFFIFWLYMLFSTAVSQGTLKRLLLCLASYF